jgi:transcriptional regulator GlxA family with amidase domain
VPSWNKVWVIQLTQEGTMNRRQFVSTSLAAGAASLSVAGLVGASRSVLIPDSNRETSGGAGLLPPAREPVKVGFVIGEHFNVIDTSGPWEVFQDAIGVSGDEHVPLFELFVVAETTAPVRGTGGLVVVPQHSFASAPSPRVVVIPAQHGSPALHEWIRATAATADLTMSVCTGAFQLAATGLLDGLTATTHHDFYDSFERSFPKVKLQRGLRYVEHTKLATAGGLTSGIDLALRVVERYYGKEVAGATARYMEYSSAK